MENYNKYCRIHQKLLLNNICIAPSDRQRKYCQLCQFSHQAEKSEFLSSSEFKDQYISFVRSQIEQYKTSYYSNIYKFTSIRKTIESEIEMIKKNLDYLKKFFLNIEIKLSNYDNLLQNYSSPEELSSYDLSNIIELKDGKELNNFEELQKTYLKSLNQIQSCLIGNIKSVILNLNENFNQQPKRQQYQGNLWNNIQKRFTNIQFEIEFTSDNKIKYLANDGQIQRIQNILDSSNQPEILKNYDQIKCLQWEGEYGEYMRKNGKWGASWNKKIIPNVGGYYTQGVKQGLWVQCAKNFCMNQACVVEIGEYKNNIKKGNWSYAFENQKIQGGTYYLNSIKNGKWVELSKDFYFYSQVTYVGDYKHNQKVGMWEIWYKNHVKQQKNLQIGGGSYCDNIKFGKWVELSEGFFEYSQVTLNGDYKYGKKIGRWDIWYTKRGGDQQSQQIGGGSYDERGDGTKIGYWVEMSDGFYEDSQVTNNGEYKNGKKVGRWDMWYRKGYGDQWNKQVGGGSFDDGIKVGKWTELSNQFRTISQVTYGGDYQYGRKVNRWDIWYKRYEGYQTNDKIGGGSYDKEGNNIKIGHWVEQSDGFYEYSQITYCGDYKKGNKVGRWDTWYKKHDEDQINTQVIFCSGGGIFVDSIKIGRWIDLNETFRKICQVIYQGEYSLGQKVGRWETLYKEDEKFTKIGGGSYDDGIKIHQWIELSDVFCDYCQVTYNGVYKKGQKIGIWDIWYKRYIDEPYKLIKLFSGGGSYDEQSNGNKIGYWIELSDGYKDYSQVIYKGKYKNNNKVGRWDICYRQNIRLPFGQIGGGSYEEEGNSIKIGNWIELSDDFKDLNQITYSGEYREGKKVGIWVESDRKKNEQRGQLIYDK